MIVQSCGVPPGYLLVQDNCEPPPLKATFNGGPEKLACFLNQVWIYLGRHRVVFPDEVTCVNAIVANLEGEAAERMVALPDEGAPELGIIDDFLEGLQTRFWDPTQAESDICSIRQGNRPMAEYI
ncbi:hypothetical protein NXF25_019072 [Crotalus adamanteus]|uniref:Uncharacterized protein n=1 Tax=Crotalus adamanteus TaxID=8729 RepID=A0AAW1B1R6_CROAD